MGRYPVTRTQPHRRPRRWCLLSSNPYQGFQVKGDSRTLWLTSVKIKTCIGTIYFSELRKSNDGRVVEFTSSLFVDAPASSPIRRHVVKRNVSGGIVSIWRRTVFPCSLLPSSTSVGCLYLPKRWLNLGMRISDIYRTS